MVSDHLGSVAVLTGETGAVAERDAYDAWGKRRKLDGTDDTACALVSQTTRGFTGHEHIDDLCLIDANARLYDPKWCAPLVRVFRKRRGSLTSRQHAALSAQDVEGRSLPDSDWYGDLVATNLALTDRQFCEQIQSLLETLDPSSTQGLGPAIIRRPPKRAGCPVA
jgi:hypothetical protein